MKIGLVQVESPLEESPDARRARVAEMMRTAPRADLYLLPELWAPGYFAFDDYPERAESLDDGPTVRVMAELARELNAFVHLGSLIELAGPGRVRNTAAVLGPDGGMILRYSKIHVFGYQSREAELLEPGDTLDTVPTPFGRMATTTCYDLRFPGLWQQISDEQTEIALVPAAWPSARREHWQLLTSARAVEHQLLVVAVNAAGHQGDVELGGHSRVVDPWGDVLLELDAAEQVGVVDVADDVVVATRREFPVLADRLTSYREVSRA